MWRQRRGESRRALHACVARAPPFAMLRSMSAPSASRFRRPHRCLAACAGLCLAAPLPAEVATGVDPEAGLPFWELREAGISLRLVQRLPDQTRAFFMARGFPSAAVERVAQRCVFQTVFKNVSDGAAAAPVEYDLTEWTVHGPGAAGRPLTREFWAQQWSDLNISRPARIAFEWALFPTAQTYHPGDYNWGMSVYDLAPDSRFDLAVVWRQGGRRHTARIDGVRCAADAAPDNTTEAAP